MTPVTAADFESRLTELLHDAATAHSVPGVAVGVCHGDQEWFVGHGVTSARDPLAVDADTLFLIGSTSKTLTATALMCLVDQGKVTVDTLVDPIVPGLLSDERKGITIGQLLDHSAGWRGDLQADDTGWGDDALERAVRQLMERTPQLAPVGTVMTYNNTALVLAGHVLATLTGQPYEAAVTSLLLEPLGMANTWFFPWDVANRRLAVGHAPGEQGQEAVAVWPTGRWLAPAGGAISSVRDQIRWARFHLTGAAELSAPLSDVSRLRMQEPRIDVGSGIDGVGIGWLLRDHRGVRCVQHGGNVSNLQVSSFMLVPEAGLAVTVLGNAAGTNKIGAKVEELCLDLLLELPPAEPMARVEPGGPLGDYIGVYDAGDWLVHVEPSVDGDLAIGMRLAEDLDIPPAVRAAFESPATDLLFVGPDRLAPLASPTAAVADFIRSADGSISLLRHGLRLCVPA